jgi:outer membrane receptor protein involved in Fe transport
LRYIKALHIYQLIVATSVVIGCTTMAQAASEPSDTPSLDEVVVTATRRETRLLDTPISMTVIGGEELTAVGADAMGDVLRMVPGLSAIDSGPGQKRYALRGLQSAGEPEVALYYDEIPIRGLPGNSLDTGDDQPDFKLWDVDRIEVLRGPQGTLYGDGSMGGAIRILSKRPVFNDFEAASQAETAVTAGGSPSWRWNGLANIPLIEDRLAARVTVYYRREGGWVDEPDRGGIDIPQFTGKNLNWEHTWGGRASVQFQAADNWSIVAIAYYQDLHTGNTNELYPAFATSANRYVAKAFTRTPWDDLSRMFNLISTYQFGWADFVVTGSYQERNADLNLAVTRTNISLFGCTIYTWNQACFGPPIVPSDSLGIERVSAYSAEARLVSRSRGPLQWTLGTFVQPSRTSREGHVATTDSSGYLEYDPTTGEPAGQIFARNNRDVFDQYAFFGEGTYDITKKWDATVGLRWFHSYRSDRQTVVQAFLPGQPTGPEPFQQFSQSALFKKFELSYHLNADTLLYTQAAQGFRAGGPNYPGGFTAIAPPYKADSIWDYEIGWKTSFADRRISWSGDVFRINWSDLQQLVPTTLFSYIVNAGSARSDGFETELQTNPWRPVTLGASVTFNNAHLIGPQPLASSAAAQLHEGDRLGDVPEWTSSVSGTYSAQLAPSLELRTRVDYTYQSGRNSVVATNSPAYFEIPGGGLTGLHVGIERNESWEAALHVENLFDQYVPLSAKALDGNFVQSAIAARPRTVSLSFTARFN